MITLNKISNSYNRQILEVLGLSTDEKPSAKIGEISLTNGSTFFCMDTSDFFMFDEQNKKWWMI